MIVGAWPYARPLSLDCHSRVGGNPLLWERWIPAYAGMTIKSTVVIKTNDFDGESLNLTCLGDHKGRPYGLCFCSWN